MKIVKQSHLEFSGGNTVIISTEHCPLVEFENRLLVKVSEDTNVPCCVLNSEKCGNFYKLWQHDNQTFIQCSNLSDFGKSRVSPEPLNITPTDRVCKHCGGTLIKSVIGSYTHQCIQCDEDFYEIETLEKEKFK